MVLVSLLNYFTKKNLVCIYKMRTPVCKDSQRQCLQLTRMETHPLNRLTASARLAVGHIMIVRGGVDSLTSGFELLHSKHYKEVYSQRIFRAVLTFQPQGRQITLPFLWRKGRTTAHQEQNRNLQNERTYRNTLWIHDIKPCFLLPHKQVLEREGKIFSPQVRYRSPPCLSTCSAPATATWILS